MGESVQWLVETFFFPICSSVSLSEADSNLCVFRYGVRAHAVFLRLEKDIFSSAWGIIDAWPLPVNCLVLLIPGKEKCFEINHIDLSEGYYLFLR